ncbi:matrix protein [Tupaia paramyxovirus]|uniref:Matrix protein n=1 Tax=Tupaia paramyxovirus TaxID=92129 RepID=Q9JFN6_TPMV|nr:matrix protein [Tupaia paramyxovirus]ASW25837.1 matrix protein [Vector TPMV_P-EGFP]ASW25844.1 matrix protein [Vector TPMV_P-EGFP_H-His6]ASW25851.1 matrix protein [Vector TPMV_P-EGFP_HaEGFR]ASW25858.1 matrix protein [Vector TPMV_P-EGFP_HaCD20]AAF63390.1 matrix protein [Tupaia paramyxovirus]
MYPSAPRIDEAPVVDCEYEFIPTTWLEKGYLSAMKVESDHNGKIIPSVRVVNPGWGERKTSGYMYLIMHGIVEDVPKDGDTEQRYSGKTYAAFPLGVGKSNATPDDLLTSMNKLQITVRRTAGAGERIVFGNNAPLGALFPWRRVLDFGAVFTAYKVCLSVESISLFTPQRFRPLFLTVTLLTDNGLYKAPSLFADFRASKAVSFNLLARLTVNNKSGKDYLATAPASDTKQVVSFMVHIGNFVRKGGDVYSNSYCKKKIDRMDLQFALGAVGGLSFHIKINGKMSKTLMTQLGFHRNLCYSIMDINPDLNKKIWNSSCRITSVAAILQPSVSKDFKIYHDVFIDNTGKIMG